ncbi:MAG: acylneuraminate cytidylyltransferase family protein [Patescibacteria group bacterium]
MTKFLGIITARGGSKGIPGKNIKKLGGKPLIAYTIETALKSGVFDRVILSTDDRKIAEVGRRYGAEVPFMRPKELAKDDTATLPVLLHAVSYLKEIENYSADYIMILQPTSPFRQPFHIQEAVKLLKRSGADSVLGVSEIPEQFNPDRTMKIDKNGWLTLWSGRPVRKRISRRQDLPNAFWNTCALYLFKTKFLFDQKESNFFGKNVKPYIMDKKYALDINTMDDWRMAEKVVACGIETKR